MVLTDLRGTALIAALLACTFLVGCPRALKKNVPPVDLHVQDRTHEFAGIFCSLIAIEKRPNGSSWGKCATWLDSATSSQGVLGNEIDSSYRFLLISGFGGDCLRGPHAPFMDSIDHLRSAHSFTVETLPVSAFGSSEFNAKQIAEYLEQHFVSDQRPYIVFGYSKGAADLAVAIANERGVKDKVAALVTLSGVIRGSRLAGLPNFKSQVLPQQDISRCSLGDLGGIASMSPRARQAFLDAHPIPLVPTYSIAAFSTRRHTSKVLLPFWDYVSQFGSAEDSQMIAGEAVYPAGNYLGLLTRDHWAIAIPLEKSSLINKNDFPRPQLFEAILRFVNADLKKAH